MKRAGQNQTKQLQGILSRRDEAPEPPTQKTDSDNFFNGDARTVFLVSMVTPPKLNSSPLKNGWLEDEPFLLGWYIFRGYVKLPGGMIAGVFSKSSYYTPKN